MIVVGLLQGRDPAEVLQPCASTEPRTSSPVRRRRPAPSPPTSWPRRPRISAPTAESAPSVAEAVARGLAAAEPDDLVLVTGSLYVVGAARALLVR